MAACSVAAFAQLSPLRLPAPLVVTRRMVWAWVEKMVASRRTAGSAIRLNHDLWDGLDGVDFGVVGVCPNHDLWDGLDGLDFGVVGVCLNHDLWDGLDGLDFGVVAIVWCLSESGFSGLEDK